MKLVRRMGFFALIVLCFAAVTAVFADEETTLSIPSLEIEAAVVQIHLKAYADGSITWDTSSLRADVGHLEGTSWFGDTGNIVLGGHSELANGRPSVFASLHKLSVGDTIVVTQDDGEYTYTVASVFEVDVNDLSPVYPTSIEQLTLITCDVDSYDPSINDYHNRVVVVANRAA